MNPQQRWQLRWSLLSELVAQAPGKLGRTAIMKLAYFLQTLKGVPLDYDFRLYTYGPFDSDVLNDVGQMESLGALKSEVVYFPSGYGYEFTTGPKRDNLLRLTENQQLAYQHEIKWALDEFAAKTAASFQRSQMTRTCRDLVEGIISSRMSGWRFGLDSVNSWTSFFRSASCLGD